MILKKILIKLMNNATFGKTGENVNKTVRKVSKYGVISGPYFPVFRLNMEIYSGNLHIQFEYRKIWTKNYSVFGHFSRSVSLSV